MPKGFAKTAKFALTREECKMAKTKVSFSIEPKLQAEAECLMKTVECSSMSEFYEKAVQFYVLHLHLKHNESYFGEILSKTLEGMINRLGDRLAKMQFKDIVTGTQLFLLLANENNWSQEYIDEMYGYAVEEAKKIPSVKLWNEERRYD